MADRPPAAGFRPDGVAAPARSLWCGTTGPHDDAALDQRLREALGPIYDPVLFEPVPGRLLRVLETARTAA